MIVNPENLVSREPLGVISRQYSAVSNASVSNASVI